MCPPLPAATTITVSRRRSNASPPAFWLWVCLGAAGALTACAATQRTPLAKVYSELKVVPFPEHAPACVEIHLRNGHVLVQDGESLHGDMNIEVWAASEAEARARAHSVDLLPRAEGNVCHLRVNQAAGASLDDMSIRYRLRVPPSIKLRVFTRSAQVAVRGYRGDIEVRSETGAIEASPAGGTCTLVTESGSIRLTGAYRRAEVATETGDVAVTLAPDGDQVHLVARNDDGTLAVDMREDCRMSLSFTTRNGALDTDFPVVWTDSRPTDDNSGRQFVGTVGDAESRQMVDAQVTCGSARFELLRLPRGAPLPMAPR
jgi:hypothetical protein